MHRGCWSAYESREQRKIGRGDHDAKRDWEEDGVRARVSLIELVKAGIVPGAYVES